MIRENDDESPRGCIVRDGASAYWDDLTLLDNPHPPGTRDHSDWAEGWTGAKLDITAARKRAKDEKESA